MNHHRPIFANDHFCGFLLFLLFYRVIINTAGKGGKKPTALHLSHACVCVRVCTHEPVPMRARRRQSRASGISLHHISILAGRLARKLLGYAYLRPTPVMRLQAHEACPAFYMSVGDSNSGLHAFKARALTH